jgi:hypothetical protein
MSQTMQKKLELIARCLRDGVEVQRYAEFAWESSISTDDHNIHVYGSFEYRAKPVKPRVLLTTTPYGSILMPFDAVELTPAVQQALDAAGVDYD